MFVAQTGPTVAQRLSEVEQLDRLLAEMVFVSSKRNFLLGKSPQAHLFPAARAQKINQRLVGEIDTVLTEFTSGEALDRVLRTLQTVRTLDYETTQIGASRSFEGLGPSGSLSRQVAFLRVSNSSEWDPVDQVMAWLTSFHRTPQPRMRFYEFANPNDLTLRPNEMVADDRTYLDQPRPGMNENQSVAIKKCQFQTPDDFETWQCVDTYNQVSVLHREPGRTAAVYSSIALDMRADPNFATDRRAVSAVDGQTNLYVLKQVDDLILLYGVGWEHVNLEPPSPEARAAAVTNLRREYGRLLLRIETEIRAADLPWEIVRW